MHPAKFYKTLDNGDTQCGLCNHFCVIKNGNVGTCRARVNADNKLNSLVYGYPAAVNVDPIEKKPLFHFFPGTQVYSLGTFGCNFVCANCQNWTLSQEQNIATAAARLDYIDPEKIIENALGDGCETIAYTYNEPTIWAEYALDIMKLAHQHGMKNVWVSNGFMSRDCLDEIVPYLDAINVDLKSMDDGFYKENCGARVAPVLDNLRYLKGEQVHLEITTLIIPGLTDEIDMLEKIADFITTELDSDTPWHLSKFSPEISWKLKSASPTGDDVIYEAFEIGQEAGLKYIYVGNLPGDQKENTYCPKCGELAIRRLGYHVERFDNNGRCSYCDKNLDIVE